MYYPHGDRGPVGFFFDHLAQTRPKALARLVLDVEILGAEGLQSQQISVRSLGEKLWELRRLYDGMQYRVFFVVAKGSVWLLHAIEKKSAKAPRQDLDLARRRLKEVTAR